MMKGIGSIICYYYLNYAMPPTTIWIFSKTNSEVVHCSYGFWLFLSFNVSLQSICSIYYVPRLIHSRKPDVSSFPNSLRTAIVESWNILSTRNPFCRSKLFGKIVLNVNLYVFLFLLYKDFFGLQFCIVEKSLKSG